MIKITLNSIKIDHLVVILAVRPKPNLAFPNLASSSLFFGGREQYTRSLMIYFVQKILSRSQVGKSQVGFWVGCQDHY